MSSRQQRAMSMDDNLDQLVTNAWLRDLFDARDIGTVPGWPSRAIAIMLDRASSLRHWRLHLGVSTSAGRATVLACEITRIEGGRTTSECHRYLRLPYTRTRRELLALLTALGVERTKR